MSEPKTIDCRKPIYACDCGDRVVEASVMPAFAMPSSLPSQHDSCGDIRSEPAMPFSASNDDPRTAGLPIEWVNAGCRWKDGCRRLQPGEFAKENDLFSLRSWSVADACGPWTYNWTNDIVPAEHYVEFIHARCDDATIICPIERVPPVASDDTAKRQLTLDSYAAGEGRTTDEITKELRERLKQTREPVNLLLIPQDPVAECKRLREKVCSLENDRASWRVECERLQRGLDERNADVERLKIDRNVLDKQVRDLQSELNASSSVRKPCWFKQDGEESAWSHGFVHAFVPSNGAIVEVVETDEGDVIYGVSAIRFREPVATQGTLPPVDDLATLRASNDRLHAEIADLQEYIAYQFGPDS